ncbi:hypothetical protein ATE92_1284 [Ulvibacter sp. MAR_2010_11]|nr:hypothetical protein ATE92_1284 [Ulvibacter sp. MAR_2010_11]
MAKLGCDRDKYIRLNLEEVYRIMILLKEQSLFKKSAAFIFL